VLRQTSAESYNTIEREGLLGQLQWDVYKALYRYGPLTQGELWKEHFELQYGRPSITPRFAELERMGLIASIGERPCRYTHMTALVWDVTDRLPEKPKPRQSKKEIIAELQAQVRGLKLGLELLS
jgi:hypothetical protein